MVGFRCYCASERTHGIIFEHARGLARKRDIIVK